MEAAAALFDLDGTLVDSERRGRALWSALLVRHGVDHDETLLREFMGRRGPDVLAEKAALFPGRRVEDLMDELRSYYDRPGLPLVTPIPGAVELIRRIDGLGLPVVLVTSARRHWAESCLELLGVGDAVHTIVSGEDVEVGKPDPAGFLAGAAAVGVPPGDCVAFEDSLAGIAAAKAAGMTCVGVATTHHASELFAADLVVSDLSGVDWPLPL
ncbi:HAD family hydrolase [Sphaerisporangium corydalis]|uniref:HAD family hydrolase n=1 Tax=Sphaerisporangium corydalis TaxID=1441875 RepID=A0ABV9EB33_9ACTN|nr:HAD family phosphatase [Sphaerisporangium corydalis]